MKKIIILLILSFTYFPFICKAQNIDTTYYNKSGKGIKYEPFSEYYRISLSDKNFFHFRDFYTKNRLLKAEGYIKSIDKQNDRNTVFIGELTSYFTNGNIELKQTFDSLGVLDGEFTEYYDTGLINKHAIYNNGRINGIYTEFTEDGKTCYQTEYKDGVPAKPYYVKSGEGYSLKYGINDNKPIYDKVLSRDITRTISNNDEWSFYVANGLTIGVTLKVERLIGRRFFRFDFIIKNDSPDPITLNTSLIELSSFKTESVKDIEIYSSDEFAQKQENYANWNAVLYGIAAGISSYNAAYSSATINTTGYIGGNMINSHSKVSVYNPLITYQMSLINGAVIGNYLTRSQEAIEFRDLGYLKNNEIASGEATSGYFFAKYSDSHRKIILYISINGIVYSYDWNLRYDEKDWLLKPDLRNGCIGMVTTVPVFFVAAL